MMGIEIIGLESVASRIASLPEELKSEVIADVAAYSLTVLGQQESETPQNYVTRKAAYGVTFFSAKQRGFFFAALNDGRISVPYRRRDQLGKAWSVEIGSGYAVFKNTLEWATYVIGFAGQSRHERMVGWRNVKDFIDNKLSFRSSTFRNVVMAAVRKAIGKLRLG
jgi:hypothetical protein